MDYTVVSTQSDTHPDLPHIVGRHLQHPYQRPIPVKQRQLFADCLAAIPPHMPLILDSGCGTGRSTAYLAAQYPEHFVLGLDKSQHRLQRHHASPNITNYRLCQVELIDFWRLLAQANRPISHHFLLYPNPWPKPKHVMRRWHAHPIFTTLLTLSPYIEVRSNWQIYCDEFRQAALCCGQWETELHTFTPHTPCSAFETKYLQQQTPLFQLQLSKTNDNCLQ